MPSSRENCHRRLKTRTRMNCGSWEKHFGPVAALGHLSSVSDSGFAASWALNLRWPEHLGRGTLKCMVCALVPKEKL